MWLRLKIFDQGMRHINNIFFLGGDLVENNVFHGRPPAWATSSWKFCILYSVLINPDMQYNKQMLHRTFHASSLRCAGPLTLWVYVEEGRCLCRDVLLLLLSCVFLKVSASILLF